MIQIENRCGHGVPDTTRARSSRYGARCRAAIFVGGDQVGESVIWELEP
jgi:hypothetical protein